MVKQATGAITILGLYNLDRGWRDQAWHIRRDRRIGLRAVSGITDTYDIQATLLNQLGLDHRKLTYLFRAARSGPPPSTGRS